MNIRIRIIEKFSQIIEEESYLRNGRCSKSITLIFSTILFLILTVLDVTQSIGIDMGVILSQLQVLISIYLTIRVRKWGYTTAVLLNILLVIGGVVLGLSQLSMNNKPMVIVPICTMFIISIIYLFVINFHKKIEEVTISNEKLSDLNDELSTLNNELASTHAELEEQNELLKSYNQIIKKNEEKLSRLAYTDTLTGLPNRKTIITHLDGLINSIEEPEQHFAIAFIDLDDFKKVNDTRGHDVGDILLKTVAERIQGVMDSDDVFGRLGGDEFAMIIKRPLENKHLYTYIETFRQALIDDLIIEGRPLPVHASFGISRFPEDGTTSDELLKSADQAMYQAKAKKMDGIEFYEKGDAVTMPSIVDYEKYFHQGFENNEFYLVFQPQMRKDSKQLRGFEVLARWKSDEFGEVNPSIFLPIAVKKGLMSLFGQWIFTEACQKFNEFQKEYDTPLIMSFNIYGSELLDPAFVDVVRTGLENFGIDPKYIELEISEKELLSIVNKADSVFEQLTSLGIGISIDDFGQHMTHLIRLLPLSVNNLKIDPAFIRGIQQEENGGLPVSALIALGHQLNMKVFAKGVENANQLQQLLDNGIDGVQGYYCGKPMDEQSFEVFLKATEC